MQNKKVLLGLSGGVDSAVALILLLNKDYNVDALFMRNWDSVLNNDILGNNNDITDVCPQEKDYMDAKKIADKFNVKLIRKDFVKEYWDDVFSYFLKEYENNRTPNPDVMCNNEIKFKAFKDYATSLGYDYIATGHYAKLKDGNLLIPKDKDKDQTYFLSQLTKDQLTNVLFPLQDLKKDEVRKLAKKYEIPVFDKKDSTGICFIGERNFTNFLKNYIKPIPGNMKKLDGTIVGKHIGLSFYTIGQRKGLNLGTVNGMNGPWVVVGKENKENTLFVENNLKHEYLLSNRAIIKNNIFRNDISKEEKCFIRFRHQQKPIKGTIKKLENDKYELNYEKHRAVTPGQVAAIYIKDICIGAGFIDEVFFNQEKRMY